MWRLDTMNSRRLKVVLMQPNFQLLGKRSWKLIPYGLCLLKACCQDEFEVNVYDPNFDDQDEAEMKRELKKRQPDIVGLTSFSTEYVKEVWHHARLIKETLPQATIILGGTLPTVWLESIIKCPDIDYFVMGEGEFVLKELLRGIANDDQARVSEIKGIAFRRDNHNTINERAAFIGDLDALPFPDYSDCDFRRYAQYKHKYAHTLIPRQMPFAVTITSRGCPMQCTFCAASTVTGKEVRLRSAENVLAEIAHLRQLYGIREIIFLDDHFLFNRQRALDIMKGITERYQDLTWKCVNVAVFSLDQEMLAVMLKSGCNQITLSIESGDPDVLNRLIKKPVSLEKAKQVAATAKTMGFEVISNFVIGTPGETWTQIRRTFSFAEALHIDLCNFHIATPLPKTELMRICIEHGLLSSEEDLGGYTVGNINTPEFTGIELQILRAFEWDRINFVSPEKTAIISKIEGLNYEETNEWRKQTRRNLGNVNLQAKPMTIA